MNPLDRFADDPRWVAWRNEPRPNHKPGDKLTKVPYSRRGRKAESDNPTTWNDKAGAVACYNALKKSDGGGIGIELGDLGSDLTLAGIDVDSCRGFDGVFADWAKPILQELAATYTEISPSHTGVKSFFLVETSDVRWFLNRIGVPATGWGARRSIPGYDAKDHGPAIEPFFGGKYFTVTGLALTDPPTEIALLDRNALERLAKLIPPASGPGSGQKDRSALALGKAGLYCRRHPGCSYEDMVAALRNDPDPDILAWIRQKGEITNERELKRIWEKVRREGEDEWDANIGLRRAQFEDKEFTREVDGRWFDEYRAELIRTEDGFIVIPPRIEAWQTHSAARWADREIPDRPWFMRDWIPGDQLVGLYGKSGARKSTLILQWMVTSVLGLGFGNADGNLAQGPTYGLFCEDSEEELARRMRAMLKQFRASFSDLRDCHPESLLHAKLTTFVRFNRVGRMLTTPAWDKFLSDLDRIKPVFVGLDVVADFFGGDEIRRGQVHSFLSLLDATAHERKFGLVFSAHPSQRGIADKTLRSGSTGWEGKVRALLVFLDPTDDSADVGLSNQSPRRVLRLDNANYAKSGGEMHLVFRDGRFVPEDLDPEIQAEKARSPINDAAADRAFLDRLKKRLAQGQYVSPSKGNTAGDAPTILAGDGFTAAQFRDAMQRHFDRGTIRFDAKKRGADRWVING